MTSPDKPNRLKIGVTGASGFIGQRVVEAITRVGHIACGFSRKPNREIAGCIETRPFIPGKIDVNGLDAVVHLAGESIFGLWTERKRERILASRRDGTRALVDAILAAGENGPKILVSASATGFYGDKGDREIDETAPVGTGFLAEVVKTWEAEAHRAGSAGVRVVILRIGLALGRNGGAMHLLRPLFLAGLGAKLGSGQQWVSWVHVSDVARLAVFSIENEHVAGVLNATSPNPVRNIEFTEALARRFHRKAFLTAPASFLKATLGEFSHALLDSQRVLPRRTMELGYHCQYRKL